MTNGTINLLIDDCLYEIFSYLPLDDLADVSKVCRRWESLCQELWKNIKIFECTGCKTVFLSKLCDERKRIVYEVANVDEMESIFTYCGSFIEKLYLKHLYLMHDPTFVSTITIILKNCFNLRLIQIEDSFSGLKKPYNEIDRDWDEILIELLDKNKKLESFSLSGTIEVVGKFLFYLPKDLLELDLDNIKHLSPSRLILMFKDLKCLRSFSCYCLRDSVFEAICENTALTKLIMKHSSEWRKKFERLPQDNNLQELDIECNYSIRDDDLIIISNSCKRLRILNISSCFRLTDRGIFGLAQLTSLEQLEMVSMMDVTDKPIGNLSETLKIINCMGCEGIRDDGIIKLIERASELSYLNVIGCGHITNRTLESAIHVTRRRINNIKLTIEYFRTSIDELEIEAKYQSALKDISPLLMIDEVNHTGDDE